MSKNKTLSLKTVLPKRFEMSFHFTERFSRENCRLLSHVLYSLQIHTWMFQVLLCVLHMFSHKSSSWVYLYIPAHEIKSLEQKMRTPYQAIRNICCWHHDYMNLITSSNKNPSLFFSKDSVMLLRICDVLCWQVDFKKKSAVLSIKLEAKQQTSLYSLMLL